MNPINPAPNGENQQTGQAPGLTTDTNTNKQYQDILDQYAQEIKSPAPQETPPVNIEAEATTNNPLDKKEYTSSPVISDNIDVEENTSAAEPVLNNRINDPTVIVPPASSIKTDLPPIENNQNLEAQSKSKNMLPKIFFLVSIIIFFIVMGVFAYTFSTGNNFNNLIKGVPFNNTTLKNSSDQGQGCSVNDKQYENNQIFAAEDGCNSCTCKDGSVTCTNNTCLGTKNNDSTTKETSNSKFTQYLNKESGISLEFPSSWFLKERSNNESSALISLLSPEFIKAKTNSTETPNAEGIEVNPFDNIIDMAGVLHPSTIIKETIYEYLTTNSHVFSNPVKINIGGLTGYQTFYESGSQSRYEIFLQNRQRIIYIWVTGTKNKKISDTENNILKSIKIQL